MNEETELQRLREENARLLESLMETSVHFQAQADRIAKLEGILHDIRVDADDDATEGWKDGTTVGHRRKDAGDQWMHGSAFGWGNSDLGFRHYGNTEYAMRRASYEAKHPAGSPAQVNTGTAAGTKRPKAVMTMNQVRAEMDMDPITAEAFNDFSKALMANKAPPHGQPVMNYHGEPIAITTDEDTPF